MYKNKSNFEVTKGECWKLGFFWFFWKCSTVQIVHCAFHLQKSGLIFPSFLKSQLALQRDRKKFKQTITCNHLSLEANNSIILFKLHQISKNPLQDIFQFSHALHKVNQYCPATNSDFRMLYISTFFVNFDGQPF